MPSDFRGLSKTQAALEFATRVHAGQRRKADGGPFIAHPLEVASLLYRVGAPDHLIAAGALHDTLEKTDTDASELRKRFGTRTARLVVAVSEDERISPYAERKAALRNQAAAAGEEALMLFAADKVSKARELRLYPTAAPGRAVAESAITATAFACFRSDCPTRGSLENSKSSSRRSLMVRRATPSSPAHADASRRRSVPA